MPTRVAEQEKNTFFKKKSCLSKYSLYICTRNTAE